MAIRKGDWKLVRYDGTGMKLYNVAKDVGEADDLAAKEPERVKELRAAWQGWDATLTKPLWGGGRKAK